MSDMGSVSVHLVCDVTLVSRECLLFQCPRLDKVAQSHQQTEEVDQDPRSKDQTSPPVSRPRWHKQLNVCCESTVTLNVISAIIDQSSSGVNP